VPLKSTGLCPGIGSIHQKNANIFGGSIDYCGRLANGVIFTGGNRIPIIEDTVDYSKLDKIKAINDAETDTLTDILYNIGYKRAVKVSLSSCYDPRNAILFIDNTGRTFAYIEICFECNGYRLSSSEIITGEFCSQKYDYLRLFFERNGISVK
jgi:hypothetical protein